MVDGKLLVFANKKYMGDVYYVNTYPNIQIGGIVPTRKTIPISFHHPLKKELEQALLEIGVRVPDTRVRWRIKVNGISITKEFRPHGICSSGGEYYAKLVYDITSVLKTPESLRKRRVNVTFKTEGGGGRILLEHLGILAFYPTSEAISSIYYLSGALSLEPGEEYTASFNYHSSKALLSSSLYMPSPDAVGRIGVNNHELIVSGIHGMDEFTGNVEDLSDRNILRLLHEDTGESYYPKEMMISSIILIDKQLKEPLITIEKIETPEELRSGGKLGVIISNKGETRPDSLLVVLMNLGSVVYRQRIKPLAPDESAQLEIPVNLPAGEYEVVLRLIWNKLSRNWFEERRIRLRIT